MIRNLLLNRRQAAGAAAALAIRIASAVIAFVSQILLARWLGADDFGVLAALLVWVNVLGTLSTLGIATSVLHFLPQYLAEGSLPLARGFHRTDLLIALLAGTAITALGLFLLSSFVTLLPPPLCRAGPHGAVGAPGLRRCRFPRWRRALPRLGGAGARAPLYHPPLDDPGRRRPDGA